MAERPRFFRAAGVDNELTAAEFARDRRRKKSFVRKSDTWKAMLRFDKDRSGTIDWFEADAYRRKAPRPAPRRPRKRRPPPPPRGRKPRRGEPKDTPYRRDILRRYDLDSDDLISPAELSKALADIRRPPRPADDDGPPDDKNAPDDKPPGAGDSAEAPTTAPADPDAPESPWETALRRWRLRHFDDGDGELDKDERAEVAEFDQRVGVIIEDVELALMDLDADGKITPDEREDTAMMWREAIPRIVRRFAKHLDRNIDGQVTPQEYRDFWRRGQEAGIAWLEDYASQYDGDRNGRLSEKERNTLVAEFRKDVGARIETFDADGNGRLSVGEAMNLANDLIREIGLDRGGPARKRAVKAPPKPIDEAPAKDEPAASPDE